MCGHLLHRTLYRLLVPMVVGAVVVACRLGESGPGDHHNGTDGGADGGPSDETSAVRVRAGALGGPGNLDGTGALARFGTPRGVALDSAGNVLVVDEQNHAIRKITPSGVVTTFAGENGVAGSNDGSNAHFNSPVGIAIDTAGNLFVTDQGNHTIRKVTPAGVVSTIAGKAGERGNADGNGAQARFDGPGDIALDSHGNLFLVDPVARNVRMIAPNRDVSTVYFAAFNDPSGIAVDKADNLFLADRSCGITKTIAAGGTSTLAGHFSGSEQCYRKDGTGQDAHFVSPTSLAIDGAGNLFVTDATTVRKVTQAGVVTTVAGLLGDALVNLAGVTIDAQGQMFVTGNATVSRIDPTGSVTTLAGTARSSRGIDGASTAARFPNPRDLAIDSNGNIYVADSSTRTIRKVAADGTVSTVAGSDGVSGSADGPGGQATFRSPRGMAVDPAGNLLVADALSHTIRKITPSGQVSTIAGKAGEVGQTDGPAQTARLFLPAGLALDPQGNIYVTDVDGRTVRKITPSGDVSTLLQREPTPGGAIQPIAARFETHGIAVDGNGNVIVTDYLRRVRKITPAGVVTELAGKPGLPWSQGIAVDGAGAAASFVNPRRIAIAPSGDLLVADGPLVRRITADGTVTTIAGVPGQRGVQPGPLPTSLNDVTGIAVTPAGNLVILSDGAVVDVIFR